MLAPKKAGRQLPVASCQFSDDVGAFAHDAFHADRTCGM
jgi:hypothetical protein